jgi:molybdopterin-guanine dinucleotide biosynthesis protein A
MGKNKAFIEIDGVPIIQRVHALFRTLFSEIIIVTNKVELFKNLDARIYGDLIPNQGALGGLYTGIYYSSFRNAFCVACDMPFLKSSVIQYLIEKINDHDVVVPRTKDGLEPLHAIYSKNCLDPIRKIMEGRQFKVLDFYPMVKVRIVEESEFCTLDPARESFLNVNTPEELSLVKKQKHSIQG